MSTKQGTEGGSTDILHRLQRVDPIAFEEFCADLWRRQGWNAELRQASGDAGVDVVLHRNEGGFNQRAVLQVKRYGPESGVSGPDIQQYSSLRQQENADVCVVVTTSYFTDPAQERAEELDVKLIDRQNLISIIEQSCATDLVDEYAPATGPSPAPTVETNEQSQRTSSDPDQDVSTLRSILNEPSDYEEHVDAKAWEYVWNPSDVRTQVFAAAILGGGVLFWLLGGAIGAPTNGAILGAVLGAVGGFAGTASLRKRGTTLVETYHDSIYEYATTEIETTARNKLGTTGPDVSVHTLERAEHGDELVSAPPKYRLMSLVIDDSSVGIVESAWISVPTVTHNSGQLAQEFFYDQVTRLNHQNGELVIHLSDGSKHTWAADEVPERAVQDVRDRIRAYK